MFQKLMRFLPLLALLGVMTATAKPAEAHCYWRTYSHCWYNPETGNCMCWWDQRWYCDELPAPDKVVASNKIPGKLYNPSPLKDESKSPELPKKPWAWKEEDTKAV